MKGRAVSRNFKPILNTDVSKMLEAILPECSNGELVYTEGEKNLFRLNQSAIMGKKNLDKLPGKFVFYWFDFIPQNGLSPKTLYNDRMRMLESYAKNNNQILSKFHEKLEVVTSSMYFLS